ncbi:MAG: isoprenylcysteine carboxylmethyltransferase family protein [Chloroflexota bacterium]
MLPNDAVAVLVLVISAAWLAGWILVSRWENTKHTEARRRELEAEREARACRGARPFAWRAWEIGARTGLVLVPTLFVVDGFGVPLGLLYAPSLTYGGPLALPLQILGVACAAAGLVILFWVGRILAVNVYRMATDERELLQSGIYASIRHPFYLHFFLLPIGMLLLTLNPVMLVVLLAYLTLDGPVLPSTWVRDEERELAGRHGPTYAAYHERTGRWLPRIQRR